MQRATADLLGKCGIDEAVKEVDDKYLRAGEDANDDWDDAGLRVMRCFEVTTALRLVPRGWLSRCFMAAAVVRRRRQRQESRKPGV